MPEKKFKYRVKPGRMFGSFFEHGPGSVVELSEEEAGGFLDKLELVSGPVEPEPEDELAHLKSLTVAQLVQFPEFEKIPAPKPATKDAIVNAILNVRHGKKPDFNNELVLQSMTVAELKALPEWAKVPDPKPATKAVIIEAILQAREA
jgi:hypothetical protein